MTTQTIDTIIAHHLGVMMGAIESARQKDGLQVEDDEIINLKNCLYYGVSIWKDEVERRNEERADAGLSVDKAQ